MGELPQALAIIFDVQGKRSNEKIIGEKKNFPTYTKCVFCFFLFGSLLLPNLITFLFLIHFKRYKRIA